ncbi:MAG: 4-phosphoerythronate dehydrogenase [Oceanicoccus sp.]
MNFKNRGLTIVADENIPQVESYFGSLGSVIRVNGRHLASEQLKDADILLVRSVTEVNETLLAGTNVRFVATATIGTDHLDTTYLDANGIGWASAPGCNADSVVDFVISACCRMEGLMEWLLADGVVGIVGLGNVGSRLYQRLDKLGISCIGYDPLIKQDQYSILSDLDSVLAADVICLHTPLTIYGSHPSYHLLDAPRLSSLRSGTVIISAGRGAVIDTAALKAILTERDDLGTILDVWENEPDIDIDLMKRVDFGSPHIAGYSFDGKLAGTAMIYQACCQFLDIEPAVMGTEHLLLGSDNDDLQIFISEQTDVVSAVKEAVLASYDLAEDDQRLRGHMLHSAECDRGAEFDRLRKNYPVRREFSKYRIVNAEQLAAPVTAALRALGFSCD